MDHPKKLPKAIFPEKLAKRAAKLAGEIPLGLMTRLQDQMANNEGHCQVTLSFENSATGHCLIKGEVDCELNLVCNRCQGALVWAKKLAILLCVVSDEQSEANLPDNIDPVLSNNGSIDLYNMVEDELLLNLPPFPMHSEKNCSINDLKNQKTIEE